MMRLLLIALVFTGCSTIDKYRNMEKPKIELDSVEVKETDLKSAKLLFGVAVDNPNDFPLRVDAVKYDIEIGGRPMSTQAINTPTEVGAKTKSVVQLPLTVQFADVFSSIGDFLRNDKTAYKIKGAAQIGVLSLPFEEAGEFRLKSGEIQHFRK